MMNNSMHIIIPIVGLLSATIVHASTGQQPTPLRITNHCNNTIWIQQSSQHPTGTCSAGPAVCIPGSSNYLPDPITVQIPANASHDYNIPNGGLLGTRFWPKQGCDANGAQCLIGESSPSPGSPLNFTNYAPPIDSKFEATFGCSRQVFNNNPASCTPNTSSSTNAPLDTTTWWDGSVVDGYTLPFVIQVKNDSGKCVGANQMFNPSVDCSGLNVSGCPTSENLTTPGQPTTVGGVNLSSINLAFITNGVVAGCFSPCAKLTTGQGNPTGSGWQSPANWNTAVCPWPPGGLVNLLGTLSTPPTNINTTSPIAAGYCCAGTPNECAQANQAANTQYTKSVHNTMSCSAYAYAYDDGVGLVQCPVEAQYEVIFCPTSADKPTSTTSNTPATIVLPSNTTVSVLLDGQTMHNNQSVLLYTGSMFSIQNFQNTSCTMSVDTNKVITKNFGALCSYITVNGNQVIFNSLPNDPGFNFTLSIPSGASITPISVTLNGVPITGGLVLSSGAFQSPLVLQAQQGGISANCYLTISNTTFTKDSNAFCDALVLSPLPNQNILQINVPGVIPNGASGGGSSGGSGGSGGDSAPPPVSLFNLIFGVPNNVTTIYNGTPMNNGDNVSFDASTLNGNLILTQGSNTANCSLGWSNNTVILMPTNNIPCAAGVVIQNQGNGHFYVGIPSSLPASPSSSSGGSSSGGKEFTIGLAKGETIKIGSTSISWDSADKSFSLPQGQTTLSVTGANGQTRNCVITNNAGALTWNAMSQDCIGVVFNAGVLYFPAF